MTHRSNSVTVALTLALVVGCSGDKTPPQAEAPPADGPAAAAPPASPEARRSPSAEGLGGTSWQLVKIMSMDDTTHTPEDPTVYTLSFGADGTMSVLADCNRGTGSWTATPEKQLEFGAIAATQAMCPPGSLHDTYMAQFPWVRSYVIENGHLFLATMADGSIIEFEPLAGGS